MPQHPYICDHKAHERHYCGGNYPYFKGHIVQRGYGNFLGALIRTGIPLVKSLIKSPIAKQIGKHALHTGKQILGDVVMKKKPLKRSVKKRVAQTIDSNLAEMLLGKRKGGSITIAKTKRKRKSRDILG